MKFSASINFCGVLTVLCSEIRFFAKRQNDLYVHGDKLDITQRCSIRFSDGDFPALCPPEDTLGNYKGVFYVLVTSLLLYTFIRRRTRAIAQVRDSFRQLFMEHPILMWIYEPASLRFLLVNQAASQTYGYTPDKFASITLTDIYNGDVQQPYSTASNFKEENLSLHHHKNGHRFYARIVKSSTYYQTQPACLVAAINVNDRIVAEQDRHNIERALLSSALVSITSTDGSILEVNDKFCEVSGYTNHELQGKNHRVVSSGQHSKAFWEDMWKTIKAGKTWRGEIMNKSKDGSFYWVDTVINPIFTPEGDIYKYISVR
jgi:PAS domain S-box-containing protein